MYWNNPIEQYLWPSDQDPIANSLHQGQHCIFFDPVVDKHQIKVSQSLDDLCNWANHAIDKFGRDQFLLDPRNHNQIARLVKINLWVDNLSRQGNVKPLLLHYTGNSMYESGTGETRLKVLERIDSIPTVGAFICTHSQYRHRFDHLENITTLDRFAELCGAVKGQTFLFRFTNNHAPYGLDWYEYNSQLTCAVTPSESACIDAMCKYLQKNPGTVFAPTWFDNLVDWKFDQS